MQVLLFANGELNQGTMVQRCLEWAAQARVICADGGALHARALGLRPHTIIGDMDSLKPQQVQGFAAAGAVIKRHPPEKDETDLELTLLHCAAIGAESVTILGGLGGRFDQTLANILLLTHPAFSALDLAVVDGEQTIRLLRPGAHTIRGESGDTISLVPLSASVEGITTENLQYALDDDTLRLGPARGISNVLLRPRATVTFRRGLLLLAHTVGRA
ncbi:MAG: thiamine diphosphokinase [Chloroflexi bacterium]|nr:thiamine diphosphokinase [Chloroflexota bacterium]